MTALTDYTPSRIIHTPKQNGYGESWMFYILPPGFKDCTQIPAGSVFGAVYSPNMFQPPATRKGWRYVHFKVVVKGFDFNPSRWYEEQLVRPLTEVEQVYFEALAEIEVKGLPELEMA